jgi:type I restriction enzyme S subunit
MEYRLEELFDLQMGKTPSRNNAEYWDSKDNKWISIADLSKCGKYICETKEYISNKAVEESGISKILANTVVMSFKLSIGKAAITSEEMYSNEAIMAFRDKHTIDLVPEYIYYLLLAHDWNEGTNKAVMGKTLNKATLSKTKVSIHSHKEQIAIVDCLNAVTHVITSRQQQLQKLDELVKARFVEMFGAYPLNPMGWKKGTIRDVVADVRYGSSRPAVDGGKYPYLRMNNITYGGELDLSDVKRIDVPENELEKCTVRRGDVLFNRTNSKELVGKTCVYDRDEMMVLAGFVIRVRVNDLVLPEFLSAFLNTDFSKRTLLGMCKAAIGQANINAQEMQSIGIYIPPIERQQEFVQFKNQTDKSKAAVQKALDETQMLFDRLMQDYFG